MKEEQCSGVHPWGKHMRKLLPGMRNWVRCVQQTLLTVVTTWMSKWAAGKQAWLLCAIDYCPMSQCPWRADSSWLQPVLHGLFQSFLTRRGNAASVGLGASHGVQAASCGAGPHIDSWTQGFCSQGKLWGSRRNSTTFGKRSINFKMADSNLERCKAEWPK